LLLSLFPTLLPEALWYGGWILTSFLFFFLYLGSFSTTIIHLDRDLVEVGIDASWSGSSRFHKIKHKEMSRIEVEAVLLGSDQYRKYHPVWIAMLHKKDGTKIPLADFHTCSPQLVLTKLRTICEAFKIDLLIPPRLKRRLTQDLEDRERQKRIR
jgi:hypothetical protein